MKEIGEALSLLDKFPRLGELTLSRTSLIASDRPHLKSLKTIHTLHLVSMFVSKEDLEALDGFEELRSLDLSNSALDKNASDGLWARRRTLRELKLGVVRWDDTVNLSDMEHLERLEYAGGSVSRKGGAAVSIDLGRLAQLKHLVLRDPAVEDLRTLKGLKNLKHLNISFSAPIRWDHLAPVLELTRVEELSLGLSQMVGGVGDDSLPLFLDKLTALRRFSLDTGSERIIGLGVKLPDSLREVQIISGLLSASGSLDLLRKNPKVRVSGTVDGYVDEPPNTYVRFRK